MLLLLGKSPHPCSCSHLHLPGLSQGKLGQPQRMLDSLAVPPGGCCHCRKTQGPASPYWRQNCLQTGRSPHPWEQEANPCPVSQAGSCLCPDKRAEARAGKDALRPGRNRLSPSPSSPSLSLELTRMGPCIRYPQAQTPRLVQALPSSLTGSVTSGKLLTLSLHQCPHLENERAAPGCVTGLLW